MGAMLAKRAKRDSKHVCRPISLNHAHDKRGHGTLASESDMSHRLQELELKPPRRVDWDALYREGTPSWETGKPSAELIRLVREKAIAPGRTLELGCGTGANAIYLAKSGFEMTAVDSSPTALERRGSARNARTPCSGWSSPTPSSSARPPGNSTWFSTLACTTSSAKPTWSRFWTCSGGRPGRDRITGRSSRQIQFAPRQPAASRAEADSSRIGAAVRGGRSGPCRLESVSVKEGCPAWSCLMRRPVVGTP